MARDNDSPVLYLNKPPAIDHGYFVSCRRSWFPKETLHYHCRTKKSAYALRRHFEKQTKEMGNDVEVKIVIQKMIRQTERKPLRWP